MKANRRAIADTQGVSHAIGTFLMMPIILMLISMVMINMKGSIENLGKSQGDFKLMVKNIDDVNFSINFSRSYQTDNIIWADNFEESKLQWDPAVKGAGSSVKPYNSTHYYNDGHSAKMLTGPNDNDFSSIRKPFAGQSYGIVSIEIQFTISKYEKYKIFNISQDNNRNNASIRINLVDNKIGYFDRLQSKYVENSENVYLFAHEHCWHHIVLIIDINNSKYIGFIIDGKNYDLSGKDLVNPSPGLIPKYTSISFKNIKSGSGSIAESYVDDFVFRNLTEFVSKTSSGNLPPNPPTNPSPVDTATGVSPNPALSVYVSDPDGDIMDIRFYNAADNSLIRTDGSVPSGETASVNWTGLSDFTTYSWYAIADDGLATATSATWTFTTSSQTYVYMTEYHTGLIIFDISNPSSPSKKGSCTGLQQSDGLFVSGQFAYVGEWCEGLRVIDVSNPTNPILKSTGNESTHPERVWVTGSYAYVADFVNGLMIFDISNPSDPIFKGSYYEQHLLGVHVPPGSHYAYAADYDGGALKIYDVSDPSNPTRISTYNGAGNAKDVYVTGRYAYLCEDGAGLYIIDISDPFNPKFVGKYASSDNGMDIYVCGKYAYYCEMDTGLKIIDVSNPTNPTLIGAYDSAGRVRGVTVSGHYAYIADTEGGLKIVDISDLSNPSLKGSFSTSDWMASIFGWNT